MTRNGTENAPFHRNPALRGCSDGGESRRAPNFPIGPQKAETWEPIETRFAGIEKGGISSHATGEKTGRAGEGKKEDFLAKNQGILGDSDESAKGTDPVNFSVEETKYESPSIL